MCKVLEVPRSNNDRWLKDPESQCKLKYVELDEKIRESNFAAKGRNGSLRMAKNLKVSGTHNSRTTVVCNNVYSAIRITKMKLPYGELMIF